MITARALTVCLVISMMVSSISLAGRIDSGLHTVLATTPRDGFVTVMALLADRVDIRTIDASLKSRKATRQVRHYEVVTALQQKARQAQRSLLAYLEEKRVQGDVDQYESYWIQNMVSLSARPHVIEEVAAREDVETVFIEPIMYYEPPINPREGQESLNSAENGLKAINAPELWKLGITGTGRLVMNIDTGVDGNHPALASRWRGTLPGVQPQHAWYGSGTFPFDTDSHGTHTMGTMTALHVANQDTIGVAPDAYWIAAAPLSSAAGAFQWAMDPDGNPTTVNDVPDVISNSWIAFGDQCFGGSQYWSLMDNAEATGIVVVWAAGNCGPTGNAQQCANIGITLGTYKTVCPPGTRNTTDINAFSVGALNGNISTFPISSFSSRGPSACDTTVIKPEVSAPGENVRSTIPNNGYANFDGTSMATPHVAGSVALLRQVNSNATVDEIKYALLQTARDLGTPGEDNSYGTGIIDVFAAAGRVSPYQVYGTVRDSASQQPINLASVYVVETGQEILSNSSGAYNIGPLQDTVQIRFSAYAHYDSTITVYLTAGTPETLDVSLRSLPQALISGTVSDSLTAQGIVAQLLFYEAGDPTGGPAHTTTSQANGSYSVSAVIGTYRIVVLPPAPYVDTVIVQGIPLPVTGTTVNFALREAQVLLVDDDGGVSSQTTYQNSLRRLNYRRRTFSIPENGGTPAGVLATFTQKPIVLWATSNDTTNALTAAERSVLISHLAGGGKVLLTGHNIAQFSPVGDTLLEGYLGIQFNSNATSPFLRGFAGDIIGDGVISWVVSGSSKDVLTILPGGMGTTTKTLYHGTSINDSAKLAGVRVLGPGSAWGATFFGFGLEALTAARQDTFILRSIRYFNGIVTEVSGPAVSTIPAHYCLEQNYPNPFNPATQIRYGLPQQSHVVLAIYDVLGREVRRLFDGIRQAGLHELIWDGTGPGGTGVASGMYFYRLDASPASGTPYSRIRKMLLVR